MAITEKEVLKIISDEKINNIQLWFTDILGMLKCISVTPKEFEACLDEGKGFDGSSITGFAELEESDIVAMPDVNTFRLLPWNTENGQAARCICDVLNTDGTPYPGDPRYVLRTNLKKASDLGFVFNVGPEIEYFYFKSSKEPEVLDEGTYFDLIPNDLAENLRNWSVIALERLGIPIEATHHEVAPSQHEIDPAYSDALSMADNIITMRYCLKEIAQKHGVFASFMPKPLFGENGSGMHVHQSLFRNGKNAFFDAEDKYRLSGEGSGFVAGQLVHIREFTSVVNQWINSYKRLVPGYEAPVYVSWGQRNRSALIRIPGYRPGDENATRAELRCPDPACNPYLAFSVMLAAGLEGIKREYKLPAPVEPNIYKMCEAERLTRKLNPIPENLFEAIKETKKSKFVRECLGEHVFTRFIQNKTREWEDYRMQITRHEIEKYMPML